jgi:hypothetical protein
MGRLSALVRALAAREPLEDAEGDSGDDSDPDAPQP